MYKFYKLSIFMFEKLEKTLNYNFKNKLLLQEALTHPSMSFNQKHIFNNERLEFLGDTVLSLVIGEYLFKTFPNEEEGKLSNKKHFLVSKEVLSSIAKEINLGSYLILSNGEEATHGRENINNLENAMEAVIGAVFLDSSFEAIKSIILKLWNKLLKSHIEKDPKTALQELIQKKFKCLPEYKLIKTELVDKIDMFTIELSIKDVAEKLVMTGTNTKHIEKELAKNMLLKLKSRK